MISPRRCRTVVFVVQRLSFERAEETSEYD